MTNAEKFQNVFGYYATEMWAKPEKEFLEWINSEALELDQEPVKHGKWIFNPTDAIDLMFAKPKCSKCGFESRDGGNFCPSCGAKMIGGDTE